MGATSQSVPQKEGLGKVNSLLCCIVLCYYVLLAGGTYPLACAYLFFHHLFFFLRFLWTLTLRSDPVLMSLDPGCAWTHAVGYLLRMTIRSGERALPDHNVSQ